MDDFNQMICEIITAMMDIVHQSNFACNYNIVSNY